MNRPDNFTSQALLLVSLFFLITTVKSNAAEIKWEQVGGFIKPYGNIKQIICIDSLNCKALVAKGFFYRLISSTDGGNNWTITHEDARSGPNNSLPNPYNAYCFSYTDSNHVFVARTSGVISRSRDGGVTYDTIRLLSPLDSALPDAGNEAYWVRDLSMDDSLHGIAGTFYDPTIFITDDGWNTWKKINTLPSKSVIGNWFVNTMHFFDKDNFMLYTMDLKVSRTTDGGKSWIYFDEDVIPRQFVRSFFVNSKLGFAVCTDYLQDNRQLGHICKTEDGGLSWRIVLVDDKPETNKFGLLDVAFKDEKVGIAVGKYGKQYHTSDGGETWELQPDLDYTNSLHRWMQVIEFAGDHPLLGTLTGGLWRGTYVTNGAAEETGSPNSIEATVFPNPFVESCMIKLRLDAPSPVVVEIYDAIGRVVERREMFYSGEGELMFSPRGLTAPGLYRYRIAAGQQTFTGSMVKE